MARAIVKRLLSIDTSSFVNNLNVFVNEILCLKCKF